MRDVPELGWSLASRFHGKGFATEAVRAAVAWGDVRFGPMRTVCLIDADNLASIRVAQKCGYEVFEQTSFHERRTLFLERRGVQPDPSEPASNPDDHLTRPAQCFDVVEQCNIGTECREVPKE